MTIASLGHFWLAYTTIDACVRLSSTPSILLPRGCATFSAPIKPEGPRTQKHHHPRERFSRKCPADKLIFIPHQRHKYRLIRCLFIPAIWRYRSRLQPEPRTMTLASCWRTKSQTIPRPEHFSDPQFGCALNQYAHKWKTMAAFYVKLQPPANKLAVLQKLRRSRRNRSNDRASWDANVPGYTARTMEPEQLLITKTND